MKYLLLLVGWLNHISAILIMSQNVGLSQDEKKALELRTYELVRSIEAAEKKRIADGFTAEQIAQIRRIARDVVSGGVE